MADEQPQVLCPFFDIIDPSTKSKHAFLWDLKKYASFVLLSTLTSGVVLLQRGVVDALLHKAPDITRLDEVPRVSHPDMMIFFIDSVQDRLIAAADSNGDITLDDLVDTKIWVADQVGLGVKDITAISRGETVFTFVSSGGDLKTQKVKVDSVLRFLKREMTPSELTYMGLLDFVRGTAQTKWN